MQGTSGIPATRSPGFTEVTLLPIMSTMPENSCPSTFGKKWHAFPFTRGTSDPQIPVYFTFTRTSFSFGSGVGISS